jgi:MFS family permease
MTGARFAAWVVAAQVLTQIGAFTLPALLPGYIEAWSLSATEAGWLVGAFFGAYVLAVPVLVTLTDLLPARRIYLVGTLCTAASHLGFALLADGFWSGLALRAIAGIGWAGAYMPGLRAIADRLEGNAQSRAVSWHAAGVGIAGASSFAMAGLLDSLAGPQAAFLFGGGCALVATAIGWAVMPAEPPRRLASPAALLDFRPVLRNRAAMAWIAGYTVHTWELHALRAWAIVFLAAVLERPGAPGWLPGPTAIFTAIALLGIVISVTGNETAQKHGRGRVVAFAMGAAAALSLLTGLSALLPPWLALLGVLAVVGWNSAIYLDSSALTAGTVQAADPARRGATMGLHSMCGYAGGFVGPLGVGLALDLAGGNLLLGWGVGFGHLALVTLAGFALLTHFARRSG